MSIIHDMCGSDRDVHKVGRRQRQMSIRDGVMIGREVYSNPYLLATIDQDLFGDRKPIATRENIMLDYINYCDRQILAGARLHHMSRHVLGLFQGEVGARAFRRTISENACKADATTEVLKMAMSKLV